MTRAAESGHRISFDNGAVVRRAADLVRSHPIAFVGGALLLAGLPRLGQQIYNIQGYPLLFGESVGLVKHETPQNVLGVFAPLLIAPMFPAFYTTWMCRLSLGGSQVAPATPRLSIADCAGRAGPIALLSLTMTVLTLVGMVVLVVPGVLFWVSSYVAIPALAIEQRRPFDAIRRSFTLTEGRRGTIFLLGCGIWIGLILASWLSTMVLSAVGGWEYVAAEHAPINLYGLDPLINALGQVAFTTVAIAVYDGQTGGSHRHESTIAEVFS